MRKIVEKLRIKTVVKLIICIVIISFYSCETKQDQLNDLQKPVVLAAESLDGDILLVDGNGSFMQIPRDYYIAKTIADTYKKGDTISYNN